MTYRSIAPISMVHNVGRLETEENTFACDGCQMGNEVDIRALKASMRLLIGIHENC